MRSQTIMTDPTYADFHVHTAYSPCGHREATLTAMIARAREKGLAALGFADHVTPEVVPGCGFYDGQQLDVLRRQRAALATLAHHDDLEILMGVEADYTLAGAGCLTPELLALVDHVICAASHFHLPAAPRPSEDTPRARAELMVRMAREMLSVPGVTVWAHPFDCSAMRPLAPIMAEIDTETQAELIALANDREIAVEINGGPGQDPAYREATAAFFGLAHEMGARFTVTADAHHPDDFERLDLAVSWAHEMGFSDADFLTAAEVRERFDRKRLSASW
jgi:histidinol phosphatase-like PHP family hydrolase